MPKYRVLGRQITYRSMIVEAVNEKEAVEKAWNGEFEDVDTEPGANIDKRKWTAEEL